MKLPQLSLRELFLLIALAALGCGWWVKRRQVQAATERARVWQQEYQLVRDRLNECNAYLNNLDPNRDDHDQF